MVVSSVPAICVTDDTVDVSVLVIPVPVTSEGVVVLANSLVERVIVALVSVLTLPQPYQRHQ